MSALGHAGPPVDTGKKGSTSATAVGTRRSTPYLLLAPGMLWLTLFFLLPLVTLVITSLQSPKNPLNIYEGFTFTGDWHNYVDALSQYKQHFIRSFVYSITATVLALLIGYPLAYTIAFKAGRWKNIMLVLVIAPFFTSFLIRTNAWNTILSDTSFVVKFLNSIGFIKLLDMLGLAQGQRLLATPAAVIAGLTYNYLPFMTLPLYASLERLDPRLIEAAKDLYASAWTAFRKVTFPLSLPGVVAGTLLTFIPAAGDPVNAQLLGNPTTLMVGNAIDSQFLRVGDYPTAAALSVILMAIIVVAVFVYVRRAGTEELV